MARKRRGRGEGGVFQRASAVRWVGTLSIGYDGAGKWKRRSVSGATKAEALEKLAAARVESRAGNLPDADAMTVGQLLDQYVKSRRAKDAVRTHEERERVVRNHLHPRVGGVKLRKLTALGVESLYAELIAAGVGGWTVWAAAKVLNGALNFAVRVRLVPANPAKAVDRPKAPNREMLFLDDRQVRAVLDAAKGTAAYPLIAVALGTGARQGELLALTWDDVDLAAGVVTIRKSLSLTQDGFVVKEPKTRAGRRAVAMPAFAVEALTAHKADTLQAGRLAAPVFCTPSGGYRRKANVIQTLRTVLRRVNKAAEREGVAVPAGLRFHDLRHTVASLLLSRGCSVVAVSRRLGHAKPSLTLNLYGHVMPTDDRQLADNLAAMLS